MKIIITIFLVFLASLAHHVTGGMFEAPFIFYYPATILAIALGHGYLAMLLVVFASNFISMELGHYHSFVFFLYRTLTYVIGSYSILLIARSRLRAIDKLNEYIEIRDNFFAMSSHELKTPLTALKLRLQLRQRRLPPESTEYKNVEGDLAFVNKMIRLIGDMLDISRVNRGNYTIKTSTDDLNSIVREAVEQSQSLVPSDRGIRFCNYDRNIIGQYDRTRIQQVVGNLVDNSVKYGEGQISISIYLEGNNAIIKVSDKGIIESSVRNHIFEKFRRGNTGHGGLGVGLFLGREIITLHGGTISLDVAPKTAFVIRLPYSEVGSENK
jgi:signal transduction histidine kinase